MSKPNLVKELRRELQHGTDGLATAAPADADYLVGLDASTGAASKMSLEAIKDYLFLLTPGDCWFVDSVNGSDTNDGTSWEGAFATIAAAYAACAAGDTIFLRGAFTESVTVTKAGLSFIGVGTCPRETQWAPMAGNDKVNLTLNAAYTRVEGIYFKPGARSSTYSACIVIGTAAAHTRIRSNQFQGTTGAYYAIYSPTVGADNVHILGNEFRYFNTATYGAAIKGVNAGGVQYSAWKICGNVFHSCVTAIKLSGRVCTLSGNVVAEYGVNAAGALAAVLALGIDLAGDDATNSGGNQVVGNQLGGTYNATLYKVGTTGDQWAGNLNVLTGGVTAANPA